MNDIKYGLEIELAYDHMEQHRKGKNAGGFLNSFWKRMDSYLTKHGLGKIAVDQSVATQDIHGDSVEISMRPMTRDEINKYFPVILEMAEVAGFVSYVEYNTSIQVSVDVEHKEGCLLEPNWEHIGHILETQIEEAHNNWIGYTHRVKDMVNPELRGEELAKTYYMRQADVYGRGCQVNLLHIHQGRIEFRIFDGQTTKEPLKMETLDAILDNIQNVLTK